MNKDGNKTFLFFSFNIENLHRLTHFSAVQHERGPRKVKPKILSVSNMILPSSSTTTTTTPSSSSGPPVACSSSPTMTTSTTNSMHRKAKHLPITLQNQLSSLTTMENYQSFSSIMNQVEEKNDRLFIHSFDKFSFLDGVVRSRSSSSFHNDQLVTNSSFV